MDPLLTPITLDPAHPFPRVINKALCLALLLRRKRKGSLGPVLGVVTIPRALPRLVPLPSGNGTQDFIFLHDLIERHAGGMYRGYEILSKAAFRVTRNSNLYFQEEEARNLLETVRSELHNRRKGDAVRLEIEQSADPEIVDRLRVNFELEESQIFRTDGPVNLSRLMNLYSDTPRPDLKFAPFVPRELRLNRKSADLFDDLRHRDILLHHPFDSYDGVVSFVQSAAQDPNVVSIKQTLYRTSSDSPMFQALTEAAQSKEVTVVVELMARFDEASNIRWARNLEDAGVQVFHGIVGLKTHCKLALLVRRDEDGVIRRYAHLGTGNYNPNTAQVLHGHQPVDGGSGDYGAACMRCSLFDGALGVRRLRAAAGGSADAGGELHADDPARDGTCGRGTAGAHYREDEFSAGAGRDRGAVCRVEGGSADRSDYSRHLRAAAGSEGHEREHPGALGCGPVSRAQQNFLFSKRRERRSLLRQRGLDAAELVRAMRGGVSHSRSAVEGAATKRDSRGVPGGYGEGAHAVS